MPDPDLLDWSFATCPLVCQRCYLPGSCLLLPGGLRWQCRRCYVRVYEPPVVRPEIDPADVYGLEV